MRSFKKTNGPSTINSMYKLLLWICSLLFMHSVVIFLIYFFLFYWKTYCCAIYIYWINFTISFVIKYPMLFNSVFLLNRTGKSPVKNVTQYELWYEVNVLKGHFGQKTSAYICREKREKHDKKSAKGVFVEYSDVTIGYRFFLMEKTKLSSQKMLFSINMRKMGKSANYSVRKSHRTSNRAIMEMM